VRACTPARAQQPARNRRRLRCAATEQKGEEAPEEKPKRSTLDNLATLLGEPEKEKPVR